ncbi:MAG: LysR family transcriptional regulator, partial [Myxococcota bacterium]
MNDIEPSDLASLLALDALLQEQSVSRAATRLGVSTPAVSHTLARLRTRFDDELLVRAGRKMVLTPRAEELRERVREAVASADRVFSEPEAFDPGRMQAAFTVCATDYVWLMFGDEFEREIGGSAPGLSLRVVPNATDDPIRLRNGGLDLAIGIYGDLPPELKIRPIITDRLVCVVREGHPTVRARLSLKQFVRLEHIQVAPRGRPGGYIDELLSERDLTRSVRRYVPYFRVGLEMVASSDRVLTVSERIARKAAAELGLRVLEPPLPFEPYTLSMVWHPRRDRDSAHAWLRQRLIDATSRLEAMPHRRARRRLSRSDPT